MTTAQMDQADEHRIAQQKARAKMKSLVTIEANEAGGKKYLSLGEVHEFLTKLHSQGVDLEQVDYKVLIKGATRLKSISVTTNG